MGRASTQGMLECVEENLIDTRTVLHWHLTSNHYPPLPECLVDTAIKAIKNANEGNWDKMVKMPKDWKMRVYGKEKQMIPTWILIENMHLEDFCEMD